MMMQAASVGPLGAAPPVPPHDQAAAHLRSEGHGRHRATITCAGYHNNRVVPWATIGAPNETPFPELAHKLFRCAKCGTANYQVMPEWSGYRLTGGGG